MVATDFGQDSLTKSGYPRIIKKYSRNQHCQSNQQNKPNQMDNEPELIFEGQTEDMGCSFRKFGDHHDSLNLIRRSISFFQTENWIYRENEPLKKIPIPSDAEIDGYYLGKLIISLKSDWIIDNNDKQITFQLGSLIAISLDEILNDRVLSSNIETIFKPSTKVFIQSVAVAKEFLLISVLDNVNGKIIIFENKDAKWQPRELNLPDHGSVYFFSVSYFHSKAFIGHQSFLTPPTLYLFNTENNDLKHIRSLPARFDPTKYKVEQKESISKDGTVVPYYIVYNQNLKFNGSNPTLLKGYGGFEHPLIPYYLQIEEKLWLNRGGVFVYANTRGGSEFGPKWHQAGLRQNRQRIFDDFISIAEHVIDLQITSPQNLGIQGGSNGGLLVGTTFTQRPELFNAVICQVPLLDMLRYHKLLAGASWMEEYGDPEDEEMREYLLGYSPYHQVKPDKKLIYRYKIGQANNDFCKTFEDTKKDPTREFIPYNYTLISECKKVRTSVCQYVFPAERL